MNELIITGSAKTMTSLEIAELTGKRHDNVLQVCRALVEQGITESQECQYQATGTGRSYPMHKMTKRDSLVLVARLSPEFTAKVVDRWIELEAQTPAPATLSRLELIQLAMQTEVERLALADKIAADAPKVAFAEAIRSIDGVCHIGKVCRLMGIGRTKFFKKLRDDSVLMTNNLPYQKYIDKGYFTVIEQEPFTDSKGVKHPTFTAMVTGAGQLFLTRKYGVKAAA